MSGNEKTAYKNIVVALDFKDEFEDCDREKNYEFNMTLLELSSVLALSEMAVLHVVNVYNVPNAGFVSLWVEQPDKVEQQLFDSEYKNRQRQMNTIMEGLKQRLGKETFKYIMPRPHIIQGYPDQELPKFANKTEADLMVMGTVARSGVAGVIIGNTAETILSQLNCAILAVKPSDFVSPILNKISPL